MRNTSSRRSKAFTLPEVLIVLVIIAVLALVLIPGGMRMIKTARQASSASQVRLLCAGLMSFVRENGRYPMGYNRPVDEVWDKLVAPDWSSPLGLRAPLDTIPRTVLRPEFRKDPKYWRSYSMVRNEQKGQIIGIAGRIWDEKLVRESALTAKVANPSQTLLLVERFDPTNVRYDLSGSVIDNPNEQLRHGAALTVRKGDKRTFVYGFCDGHVEILTPQQTIGTGTMELPLGMWSHADGD